MTVRPETTTARPEVRRRDPERLRERSPLSPLLAFPAQVEEGVVDSDGHPDEQHDLGGACPTGSQCPGTASSESVVTTAVAASSSGMAAAISAPKTTSSKISVIGTEVCSGLA